MTRQAFGQMIIPLLKMSGDEYARVFDENPMKRLKKQKEPIKETGLSGVKYEKFKNVGILTIEHFIVG